jgi:DNA replication protein DnaC
VSCEWIERHENVIALARCGTGKTQIALGQGLAACQKGMSISLTGLLELLAYFLCANCWNKANQTSPHYA